MTKGIWMVNNRIFMKARIKVLVWQVHLIFKETHSLMETQWKMSTGMKLVKKVNQKISPDMKRDLNLLLKMELAIKVNGKKTIDMVKELKYGQMVQNMRVCGKIIKLMAKELSGMFMEINMKENGKMISRMVMA